jgi:DNA modification methylase
MRPSTFDVLEGDAVEVLRVPAGLAQTCVTSPPYFGLRDYGEAGQIGLEETIGEYLDRLVAVFDEVHRVLRDDGTLWLNLGDSYATRWASTRDVGGKGLNGGGRTRSGQTRAGFKEKDLMGVPWRVAFALQDAGWWLRKAIVWHKPNPTPEPVRDRPTSSHELVFLMAKATSYHYDDHGWREPTTSTKPSGNGYANPERVGTDGRARRNYPTRTWEVTDERNARDVWTIATVPFPSAHFAVFPPELPRRCIALGTSPRACPDCGAPWRRRVERTRMLDGQPVAGSWDDGTGRKMGAQGVGHTRFTTETRTLGWQPTCPCGAPPEIQPGDLDEILSPIADTSDPDPSLEVGRAGLARPRTGESGSRTMTRWEQRHVAAHLAASPHRAAMAAEAGREAFAHYLRTDRGGARAVRPALLDRWRELRWIPAAPPVPPAWWSGDDAGRCLVLDPFAGSGTTGRVAIDEGRDFLGVELSPTYAAMARERIGEVADAPRFEML